MPSHTHNATNLVYYERGTGGVGALAAGATLDRTSLPVDATGGSGAHNNMPPFLAIGNLFIYAGV